MKKRSFKLYFSTGVAFFRENPQLWFTVLVGVMILGSFVFMTNRFASIAQDAQEQLFNDRAGWLLDGVVLFVPDTLDKQNVLRERLASLMEQNATIDTLNIIVPYGNKEWHIYVAGDGEQEGSVVDYGVHLNRLFSMALTGANMQSIVLGEEQNRRWWTIRAITDESGRTIALAVLSVQYSEADRRIESNINTSIALLVGVLIIIMVLFIRHARIVDYASLYKKQLEIDEMKDSFVSMAGHELKSPLSVIRGYIEYLKDGEINKETQREFLDRIDVSADELRMLIDDILDVSRIEMGRMRFTPDYIQPSEILKEVVEMFTITAQDKGLALTFTLDETIEESLVRVDRTRLKQVIINLMSNAMKYTLKGTVLIEQKLVGNNIEISIRDSGVGMTAEEQKKLFGKFYRVQAKETRSVRGTGLGLWITKYITEQMGGTISVESIKGEGSRFVVAFPRHIKGDIAEEGDKTP